jgi:hypothetical protein
MDCIEVAPLAHGAEGMNLFGFDPIASTGCRSVGMRPLLIAAAVCGYDRFWKCQACAHNYDLIGGTAVSADESLSMLRATLENL